MSSSTPMENLPPNQPDSSPAAAAPEEASPTGTQAAPATGTLAKTPLLQGNNPSTAEAGGEDEDDGTEDTSVKKLELKVNGFIDVSGMVSTVGVLTLLLGQETRNDFFTPLIIFISMSITLQVILAIILIIRHTFVEEARLPGESAAEIRKYNFKSRMLLTVSSVILLIITVFNIFIVAFAGVATGSTSSTSTTSSPN